MSFVINPYVFGIGGGGSNPTFPTITDVWEWWEPERGGFADNDAIGTLVGQVAPGAGHDFVQATAGNKPTFKTGIVNGLGVARFDGATDYLEDVDPSALTAAHLFIVIKPVVETHVGGVWDFGTSASQNHYKNPGDLLIYDGSCSTTRRTVGAPGMTLDTWRVKEVVSTSSEWTYTLDGTQLFTTGTNTVGIKTDCFIGQDNTNERACDIAGVYLFSAKLGTTDRNLMVTYLNARWGLSMS